MKSTKLYAFVLIGLLGLPALSAEFNSSDNSQQRLHDLQQRWATVNYQLENDKQKQEFEALVADAQQWVEQEPESAPAH